MTDVVCQYGTVCMIWHWQHSLSAAVAVPAFVRHKYAAQMGCHV